MSDVHVIGLGAQTAVGRTLPSAAAAVRACIVRQAEHPFMTDGHGEPVMVSRAAYLPDDLPVFDRLLELAFDAMLEALTPLAGLAPRERAPVLLMLGLPPVRPGVLDETGRQLVQRLPREVGDGLEIADVWSDGSGHLTGLGYLTTAMSRLADGEHRFCLVGGVDSYIEPATLQWLDGCDRLASDHNPYGFCPGEGAGFCLLAADPLPRGLRSLGRIAAVGIAREERLIGTGAVCTGEGLTKAWSDALQALPEGAKVTRIFCDLNGEPYRTDEHGFALTRFSKRVADPSCFVAPAACWGDVGAASGPLLVGLAIDEARTGLAPGRFTLVWTSADSGWRSAALLDFDGVAEPSGTGGR